MKPMGCEVGDGVIAVGIEAGDLGDRLDAAARAAALDEDNEIDRLGDQPARHADDAFLHELLEPVEGGARGVGVDGGDAAWMTGVQALSMSRASAPRTSPTMIRSGDRKSTRLNSSH